MQDNDLSKQFPLDSNLCYLNHAAVSPWPKCTADEIKRFANENCHQGSSDYLDWLKVESELRKNAAKLLGNASITEIALLKSTSEALSTIAYGIDWQEGDEIIISDQEFPSNRIVWESLKDQGVKVIQASLPDANVPDIHDKIIESITGCITPKTRLLAISSVQYASGILCNLVRLGELCREHDMLFCVDAIQSLGALPFDNTKIQADFVVADGHKWMMGPEGISLCYINKKHIPNLKLHEFGWHMVKYRGQYDRTEWQPAEDATRFECGSPNMLGIHALNASLRLIHQIGINKIEQQLNAIIDKLIESLSPIEGLRFLSPIDKGSRAGIVTFEITKTDGTLVDHEKLYRNLMARGVICAHRGGGIRFSPHFYTPLSVILNAVEQLKEEVTKD